MNAVAILKELEGAGIDVRLDQNGTALSVPKGRLSQSQRQLILSNRTLLIEHLRRMEQDSAPSEALSEIPIYTPDEIATFEQRVKRLTENGMSVASAEELVERLVKSDRAGDVRRMCLECTAANIAATDAQPGFMHPHIQASVDWPTSCSVALASANATMTNVCRRPSHGPMKPTGSGERGTSH